MNAREQVLLDKALTKLVFAAEQVGLHAGDLIDMLNGGMTTLQIVLYLETQAAGRAAN